MSWYALFAVGSKMLTLVFPLPRLLVLSDGACQPAQRFLPVFPHQAPLGKGALLPYIRWPVTPYSVLTVTPALVKCLLLPPIHQKEALHSFQRLDVPSEPDNRGQTEEGQESLFVVCSWSGK